MSSDTFASILHTFSVDVSSRYNTTREAEFCIKVTLGEGINEDVLSSHREHIMYVKDILIRFQIPFMRRHVSMVQLI